MSWQDIDLFEMEASWFSEELHAVVVPLFQEGSKKLAEWEKERRRSLDKVLSEAKDELEQNDAHDIADLEEWRNRQRSQVLGAAVLHHLFSTLKSALKELARYLDKTHPKSAPYKGKSGLDRLKDEFLQRFGVDFDKSGFFDTIRELALARNAGIHTQSLSEYQAQVKSPRFCRDGEFNVELRPFMEVLDETERFFGWVANEMRPLRKPNPPEMKSEENSQ